MDISHDSICSYLTTRHDHCLRKSGDCTPDCSTAHKHTLKCFLLVSYHIMMWREVKGVLFAQEFIVFVVYILLEVVSSIIIVVFNLSITQTIKPLEANTVEVSSTTGSHWAPSVTIQHCLCFQITFITMQKSVTGVYATVLQQCKARQGNFIYIAPFIHKAIQCALQE